MRNARLTFSKIEVRDLFRAWIAISLAFAIAYTGLGAGSDLLIAIVIAAITAGLGFLLHELAHKFVAIHYGCSAEFRANTMMLWIALITSFFGFIFAAPGAVYVQGVQTKKENGIISAAGPITNIVLAVLFAIPLFATQGPWNIVFMYGVLINGWLALFNMIPIMPFDGAKIWRWNKIAYFILVILGAIVVFGSEYLRV